MKGRGGGEEEGERGAARAGPLPPPPRSYSSPASPFIPSLVRLRRLREVEDVCGLVGGEHEEAMAVGAEAGEGDGAVEGELVASLGGREVVDGELAALGPDGEQPRGLRDGWRAPEELALLLARRERVEEHAVRGVREDEPVARREQVLDAERAFARLDEKRADDLARARVERLYEVVA